MSSQGPCSGGPSCGEKALHTAHPSAHHLAKPGCNSRCLNDRGIWQLHAWRQASKQGPLLAAKRGGQPQQRPTSPLKSGNGRCAVTSHPAADITRSYSSEALAASALLHTRPNLAFPVPYSYPYRWFSLHRLSRPAYLAPTSSSPMPSSLFTLPSSLLLLSLSNYLAAAEPWPYNLPKHEKYWPEHEEFVKRDAHIRERVARQPPAGVQKMSHDPGEKFYLDYWQFEELNGGADQTAGNFRRRAQALDADTDEQYSNSSLAENLLPPLLLHSDSERSPLRFFQRNLFEKRDYQCPTGTNSCASISRPNSCCPTDETCVIVEDTGLGDVGCCPAGSSCSGSVSQCNTDAGYTSCPESDNGGCCIPGYSCQDVGCKFAP